MGARVGKERHVIIAATNAAVDYYNTTCQAIRKSKGLLRGSGVEISGQRFYRGDQMIAGLTSRKLGTARGRPGEVVSIRKLGIRNEIAIRFDEEKDATWISVGKLERAGKKYGDRPLHLGYAATVHRFQGRGFHHVYWDASGGMTDKKPRLRGREPDERNASGVYDPIRCRR